MRCTLYFFIITLLSSFNLLLGQTATITGVVFTEKNKPLENVSIKTETKGAVSNSNGFFVLEVSANTEITITFSHIGYKNVVVKNLIINNAEIYELYPVLQTKTEQITEVVITANGERKTPNLTTILPSIARKIPGANAGVENILKLLPSVTSNNELSTQYAVRGGNYDENLVYVNEIEVYRPFLIRSGQQEGLSFINTNLTQKINFSAGGFQAKYGDKLSSVLDITYKKPISFNGTVNLSFLGADLALETASKNKKLTTISGARYRDNNLFLNSKQTTANYKPTFLDLQTYATYKFSDSFHLNFLGSASLNNYTNEPQTRQTNFGTLNNPKSLTVYYNGQEKNKFNTVLGALKAEYFANKNLNLKLISSLYHTTEEEYSDVYAQYAIGGVNTDLSSDSFSNATTPKILGSQFKRTRNDLDALLFNIQHKGKYSKNKTAIEWGIGYKLENIRDQLRESEFIDSAGYFIRPPLKEFQNNEPYAPNTSPLVAYSSLFAKNNVTINRLNSYVQFSKQTNYKSNALYYNLGIRFQYWNVNSAPNSNSNVIASPRAQFTLKPNWKKDMLFKASIGVYQQAPFYRELRDTNGTVQTNVKAQKAIHYVLGNDYSFLLWKRPFSLKTEAYYKNIGNVNAYTLEDVRIRYLANNNSTAYVYGLEARLNGAFVPGTESWVSIGFLKTEENQNNKGYIARPTDQRFKLGVLFQDYLPTNPNVKMYLNLVYNTGLPGGSPNYADPYKYNNRLKDYKRADLGISYIFADRNSDTKKGWLRRFKNFTVGAEIFNLFNTKNAITNTWVRDADSKQQYAVPNYMTSRVLNLKIGMQF